MTTKERPAVTTECAGLPVPLGKIVAKPGLLARLTETDIRTGLRRHLHGDWGDCDPEDAKENDRSLEAGFRLLSVYRSSSGIKFWVITEADRSVTTVLLPEEY